VLLPLEKVSTACAGLLIPRFRCLMALLARMRPQCRMGASCRLAFWQRPRARAGCRPPPHAFKLPSDAPGYGGLPAVRERSRAGKPAGLQPRGEAPPAFGRLSEPLGSGHVRVPESLGYVIDAPGGHTDNVHLGQRLVRAAEIGGVVLGAAFRDRILNS